MSIDMIRIHWAAWLVLVLLLGSAVASYGADLSEENDLLCVPRATFMGGVGHAMGWFGFQGEYYFNAGRASTFFGVGYTPDGEDDLGYDRPSPSGATVAFGGRVFRGGSKHRAFLEASISQLVWESYGRTIETFETNRLYGPGIQVGYQRIADSGFTFLISSGVGYAIGTEVASATQLMLGLGIGGTLR